MLQELAIKNFAIIEDLRITFDKGLTILSGETGAGKSIIINAFNLLLGSRPSAKLIRAGAKAAEIEAVFSIRDNSAAAWKLSSHGYQTEGQLLIKRLVSGDNRHKVYINGSLATLQVLTDITAGLASISGQHAHQQLLREENHLFILDQYAGLLPLREQVRQSFQRLSPLLREREKLLRIREQRERQVELLTFQKEEIRKANLTVDEDEHLENEKNRLKHAERLYALVYGSIEGLYDAQGAVTEQLVLIRKSLEEAEQIDLALSEPREAISDMAARVEETAGRLRAYLDTVQRDDQRLEAVEERLDLLSRLKKKYGQTLAAVLARLSDIEAELSGLENIADTIADLEEKIAAGHKNLSDTARRLSAARKKAAREFSTQVARELAGLKMTGTGFEVAFSDIPVADGLGEVLSTDGRGIDETGLDRAVFQISPNVGEPLKPLADIASGGELSRVVLALKAILAEKEAVGTIVFDEVDAGIGGETADVVGKKLLALSDYHQVLCITHLPQIAKFGDSHYRIEKEVSRGRTKTSIKALSPKDRLQEIARMSGGEKITAATLAHAKEMLEQADRSS